MQKRYPFPFLDAYEREDRDFFFGRDEEIETLYQLTQQSNIILLYGSSGTGKTSLIRCGLSNKFKSYDWQDVYIRRGEHLIRSLDRALCEEADRRNDPAESDGKAIADLPQKLEAVYKTTFKPLYLIFDQFEELYTLGSKDEEQAFIATVREILRVEQPVKIILSIREEYLGHLYEFDRQVPELLRKKLRIEPMFTDRVQQVILGVGSLPQSNVQLQAGEETAIATRIFEKLRGEDKTLSIQLPYLQVLLDKYYLHCTHDESRQAEATFTLATLDTLGDLGDVLRNFLDEQVQHIARQLTQPVETLWQLLSPFVTLDGTKEPLSEAELRSRLPEGFPTATAAPALQAFVQRRVLRHMEQTARYEVAHGTLAKQLHARRSDEEIALLEVQRLIRSQVAIKPEAREYFSARQLAFIEEVLPKLRLTAEERAWVEESRRYREQEAQAEAERQRAELAATKRRLRVVRGLLAGVAIALVVAIGAFFYAQMQIKIAEKAIFRSAVFAMQAKTETLLYDTDRPTEIYYDSITALIFRSFRLKKIPQQVFQLKNLESLDLGDNSLTSLPPEIGQLKNLTELGLSGNPLTSLPPEIGQLKNLTELGLSANSLTSLPPEIGQLKNLTELGLNGNSLTSLPPEIGQLKNLTWLDFSVNQLTRLPPEIVQLKNLTALDLNGNSQTSLPPEIVKLKNLTWLDFSVNELTSLPPEIGELKSLTELELSFNQLSSLPAQIGGLKNLTILSLSNNQLSSLPPQIGELKNLTSLDLRENQLTNLPAQIGELKKLTWLYLSENPIPEAEREKIRQWLPWCEIEF